MKAIPPARPSGVCLPLVEPKQLSIEEKPANLKPQTVPAASKSRLTWKSIGVVVAVAIIACCNIQVSVESARPIHALPASESRTSAAMQPHPSAAAAVAALQPHPSAAAAVAATGSALSVPTATRRTLMALLCEAGVEMLAVVAAAAVRASGWAFEAAAAALASLLDPAAWSNVLRACGAVPPAGLIAGTAAL